ncbi:MAG: glycosyltransferase family 1 protein [Acidobacteria bacterium]|nr:MAG: glycosyltransferase family 1 protein [Acidobacteriota bacterium]
MPTTSVHIDTARTWRGGQNQVLLTVTGLSELGHPAVLVANKRGELARRAAERGKEGLRFLPFSPKSEFDVHAAWQLARIFADVRPDVIHAHDPHAIALMSMALKMPGAFEKRPLIAASRRVDFHLQKNAFSRWKNNQVDVWIAASGLIAGMLERDGIPAGRIRVVHEGVSVSKIDKIDNVDAHAVFFLPHNAPLVGNVAALVPHKGQRHFIAAAARVIREVPDARFVILGEGELREPLERQIKELGLERHVILGGFRTDVIGLIKSFDIFVMSSITEGLGTSILDAMACAKPVIGTRTGGIPEAVRDEETGVLVPPQDEGAMAAAIIRLLKDKPLAARLGASGRQRAAEYFSVERMVAETLGVYQKAGSAV